MHSLLEGAKVIVCVGSGGVGKTTISASLAVLAARQGKNTLVLTIDPSRRLAQALGIDISKSGEFLVPNQDFPGKLYAGLIDANSAFDDFVRENSSSPEIAERLLKNTLYKQLSTGLSGSQEFTSLDKLYRSHQDKKFDLVILDTPPAQNAREFFSAPEKIYSLFQKSVTKWFTGDDGDQNFLQRVLNKGTSTVLSALERVTGSEFIGELGEFFNCIKGIQDKVSERSMDVHRLLLSQSTHFVLVTSFDSVKMREAKDTLADLKKRGYFVSTVLLNRSFPQWINEDINFGDSDLEEYYRQLKEFYENQGLSQSDFQSGLPEGLPLVKIPEINHDIYGVSDLGEVADLIKFGAKDLP